MIPPSRTHVASICRFIVTRGGLSHKPGCFSRSPRQISAVNFSNIEIRQTNVDDDNDDDDDDNDDDNKHPRFKPLTILRLVWAKKGSDSSNWVEFPSSSSGALRRGGLVTSAVRVH